EFGEGVFDKIFDIAQIARFSKEERAKYEANMMNQRDQYAALKCARDEGREEGVAIGKEEGEARGMEKGREEVFSLLESGMSLAEAKRKLSVPLVRQQ
ncbi:MAG: Rpn family recombination-promoting nuclease/putative transposase, partial [Fibromonadaceae bacterium]|nr:Rpn family recombination-promoting nuclease/putative transposase [Fibromonadaceae bacterium]